MCCGQKNVCNEYLRLGLARFFWSASNSLRAFAKSAEIQVRIYNTDGTPASAQIAYNLPSGLSETLIVDFDYSIDQLKFTTFSLRTSDFAEEGHYAIYNDGQLVYETDFVATFGRGNDTFNVSGHGPFDQIVFSALIQTDLSDGSDYGI